MIGKIREGLVIGLIYLVSFFSVILLAAIIGYVLARGLSMVSWSFLTTVSSALRGTVGIAGNIVNTLYIVILTLMIAVPIGIGSAIWLNEYAAKSRLVGVIEFATETLAGIPSVIFGLFGMVFFGTTLRLGYSLLTGALTLSLMILPLIIRNTQGALKSVPDSYRTGAIGMGATKWYMIRTVLLPSATPGIITSVILSIGRVVGESAALLLTAGSGYLLPRPGTGLLHRIMESGGTLAVQLYLSMSKAQYDVAFGIAAVLLCIVLILNFLTKILTVKSDVLSR